jgi:hypothetical protein
MGYIGQAPANKVVRTADIEDSIITSAKILDGTIVNADVNASAAIAESKLTVSSFDDNQIQNNIALLGFKTAVNGDLVKYSLVDQIIDEYEDNSGIDDGNSTNASFGSGSYSGSSIPTHDADATGTDGGDTWYKWTDTAATGSFTPAVGADYEVLVVAGGGGGGRDAGGGGGGGGAGGYRTDTLTLTAQAYTVTVGAGGAGGYAGSNVTRPGVRGDDSVFSTITSNGGSGGGGYLATSADSPFGSGGGAASNGGHGRTDGTSGQGYDGGTGGGGEDGAGGGGGASADGANYSSTVGGDGGAGAASSITGSSVTYAGGGGGGGGTNTGSGTPGAGGAGGGGAANASGAGAGNAGTANTGGGGGGTAYDGTGAYSGGVGGSGIVIIKGSTGVIGDLTLQSNDTTASTANPDYANMICLMENAAGTATLNTDIKGYVSEDSGVTFTQGTFVDEGTWGTNKKIIAFHDLDISAQSGSSMCYKITTHNQSAGSKETKIHATSIGWR